ncbi:MAG: hypothetical protein DCC72_01700 [Burkholderiales bacterium]|nr:MAG: hypothetical protein DCC72_01700 [Burkholderiales bacterium]
MFLLFKLTLAPASILLATLIARRFGHGAAGFLSGFPVISGPIVAALIFSLPAEQVEGIARATLAASPATFAHIVAFAWLSRRLPWWGCLIGATAAFFAAGALTTAAWMPGAVQLVLAIAGPFVALAAMPRASTVTGAVPVPRIEIAMRVAGTFVLAAAVLLSAQHVSAAVSGLLLAWPISGTILPGFTLPAYGHPATVTLLRGLSIGLAGFVWFYVALAFLLGAGVGGFVAFVAAALVSGIVGVLSHRKSRLDTSSSPSHCE